MKSTKLIFVLFLLVGVVDSFLSHGENVAQATETQNGEIIYPTVASLANREIRFFVVSLFEGVFP
jgi:hypothetical protein